MQILFQIDYIMIFFEKQDIFYCKQLKIKRYIKISLKKIYLGVIIYNEGREGEIMLRYLTAGETHGKCLNVIIEGMPAGIKIDEEKINRDLARRQKGYGRGGRMKIETDKIEILSGVRGKYTLGSPICLKIENKDWRNWENIMGAECAESIRTVTTPRPGHADLSGGMKYAHRDLRNVLERASARETAARVAAGAVFKQLLENFRIEFFSRVVSIGEVEDDGKITDEEFYEKVLNSETGFGSEKAEKRAKEYIDKIKAMGESCGGVVETRVLGVPPGLGSYAHYDRKLDACIAFSVMGIQAIKGIEFGMGFNASKNPGSMVHDGITYNDGFGRITNNAGGIEGGMSNGEEIVVRAAMKPIPTLYNPMKTVDINTKEETEASVERSDVCAVPACSVVVEAAVAFEIAKAFLEKFGGDCLEDIRSSFESYNKRIKEF